MAAVEKKEAVDARRRKLERKEGERSVRPKREKSRE